MLGLGIWVAFVKNGIDLNYCYGRLGRQLELLEKGINPEDPGRHTTTSEWRRRRWIFKRVSATRRRRRSRGIQASATAPRRHTTTYPATLVAHLALRGGSVAYCRRQRHAVRQPRSKPPSCGC